MPATRITFRDAKENLRDYFISIEKTSSFSLPIFITKSKDSDILKFLKTLLRSVDLSREQYYLTTKDSSNIKIDDLLESKMIIFEKFNDEEYKIVKQIKDFDKAPYIPIVAFVETSDKNNIDNIYDVGVDLVFQKSMFFSQVEPPKPDYSNITYFVRSLNKLFIKSDVLHWFWQVSQDIIKNMNDIYESGIKVIMEDNLRSRIIEKLKVAFGHLRKPNTTYDLNYDFTSEEFAFLTYWSCLNEYIADWIRIKEKTIYVQNKKEIIDGSVVLKGLPELDLAKYSKEKKNYFSNYDSVDIMQFVDLEIKQYFYKKFGPQAHIFSYSKISESFQGKYYDKKSYPESCIPMILLSNGVEDYNSRGLFAYLNNIRNELDYAHGNKKIIAFKNILSNRGDGYQIFEDVVHMINMLFLLLNKKWQFIITQNLQIVKSDIKRLIKYSEKEMGKNIMRFIGKIKEVNPNATDDKALIILSENDPKNITEIRFKKGSTSPDVLKSLSPNDNVEVFAKINSGTIENVYYQFIQLEDVIKIS